MACNEIDQMRQQVCERLRGTVHTWQWGLQARYGDPRVYALQQQAMNAQQAALEHDLSRRASHKTKGTYEANVETSKKTHSKRIAAAINSKRHDPKGSGTRPGSEAAPPHTSSPLAAPSRAPRSTA